MENKKNQSTEPGFETPEMIAHEPSVDLARNKNLFKKSLWFAGGFTLILIVLVAWQWFGSHRQDNNIAQADLALMNVDPQDSTSIEKPFELYKQVADAGGYKANERAQIVTAAHLYQQGNYEEALKYLDKPNVESPVVATGIYCLKGDCYANLDKFNDAIEQYNEALDEANNNPELTPYVLNKLANLYHVAGDYTKEAETRTRLRTEYPDYVSGYDLDSEIARAQALANAK